jgi:FMN phosphatase YigB (HAD superfamily)
MKGDEMRAIIFDHGGVLSLGGGKGTNERVASHAMGFEKIIKVPSELVRALKLGWINNSQYVKEVNRLYPNAPMKLTDKMWDRVYDLLKPELLSYEFARHCRMSGKIVGLFSNISSGMAARLRADGSYNDFDLIALSCDMHCAKPNAAAYAAVEALLPNIPPAEILLLDDQVACVEGAKMRGWQAMKVTSPEQMIRDACRRYNLF